MFDCRFRKLPFRRGPDDVTGYRVPDTGYSVSFVYKYTCKKQYVFITPFLVNAMFLGRKYYNIIDNIFEIVTNSLWLSIWTIWIYKNVYLRYRIVNQIGLNCIIHTYCCDSKTHRCAYSSSCVDLHFWQVLCETNDINRHSTYTYHYPNHFPISIIILDRGCIL